MISVHNHQTNKLNIDNNSSPNAITHLLELCIFFIVLFVIVIILFLS